MIDWASVGTNALWLTGLAMALAAFSHADWQTHMQGDRLRHTLDRPGFVVPFSVGMILFCLGLLLGGRGLLERVAWATLIVYFIVQAWLSWQALQRNRG